MFCEKCGSQVQQGEVFCQNCGNQLNTTTEYVSNQNQVYNGNGAKPDKNPTIYIVLAVIELALCCWPLGIPALIFATGANTAMKNGDYDTMESKLKTSKICLIIGIVGSVIFSILYAFLIFSEMQY